MCPWADVNKSHPTIDDLAYTYEVDGVRGEKTELGHAVHVGFSGNDQLPKDLGMPHGALGVTKSLIERGVLSTIVRTNVRFLPFLMFSDLAPPPRRTSISASGLMCNSSFHCHVSLVPARHVTLARPPQLHASGWHPGLPSGRPSLWRSARRLVPRLPVALLAGSAAVRRLAAARTPTEPRLAANSALLRVDDVLDSERGFRQP